MDAGQEARAVQLNRYGADCQIISEEILSKAGSNVESFTEVERNVESEDPKPNSQVEPPKQKVQKMKTKRIKSARSESSELNVGLGKSSSEKKPEADRIVPKRMLSFEDVWVQKKLVSDFDLMLASQKTRRLKAPKRKNSDEHDLINYNETQIQSLLAEMKAAAATDRELRLKGFPATKKITLLPRAMTQLMKLDLRPAFMENGLLSVLAEWLTPVMPDNSLPVLKIRETIMKLLTEFPNLDGYQLKESGVGKAVMELFRHPKETSGNKLIEQKLLITWARSMFELSSSDTGTSKEERAKRDREFLPKRQKKDAVSVVTKSNDLNTEITEARKEKTESIRPGDPGWIPRAVQPSLPSKTFLVRPKWTSNTDISKPPPKKVSRLEKYYRNFMRQKSLSKVVRAVTVSINGRNL